MHGAHEETFAEVLRRCAPVLTHWLEAESGVPCLPIFVVLSSRSLARKHHKKAGPSEVARVRRIIGVLVLFVISLNAVLFFAFRDGNPAASAERESGTRRMAERLARLAQESNPEGNPYLNRQRAKVFQERLKQSAPLPEKVDLRVQTALELLRAGDTEEAIAMFSGTWSMVANLPPPEGERMAWLLNRFLGLSYLRLGEQQNCVARHTSDSCLLPIGKAGYHEIQEGSRRAIDYFTKALAQRPEDIETVWLLNVAFMTLGEHPHRVPSHLLVPASAFGSGYEIGRFRDVAPATGLATTGRAGGVVVEDFDNDGHLDVVCSSWGLEDPLRFFRNEGNGAFSERTREAGLEGLVGGLNLVHADYNNDGYRDILVLRGAWFGEKGRHPNSLLRNNGDGTFTDVTEAAGLLSFHPTQTASWADFDGDGWLDLFIGNESFGAHRHPCELYRNNGDGTFTECAAACGVAVVGFVKGVAWADYDNDGRPDLYLSRFQEPNILFQNAGPGTAKRAGAAFAWEFNDVTQRAGVAEPIESFPVWWWDYNNDGWLDLFVASYSDQASMAKVAADYLGLPVEDTKPRLYRNNGDGTFSDVTKQSGLDRVLVSMGCNFGDLDNDGWLDFYIGTGDPVLSSLMPNRMFRNAAGSVFQDVTTSGGFGHVQKGHGIAFADIDNDGDQDVYAVLGGAFQGDVFQNALFENPGHNNHWIGVRLRGRQVNRDAIGARIEAVVKSAGGMRRIFRVVSAGGSFGAGPLEQHIGLADAAAVESLTIVWPGAGGKRQTFTNMPVDSVVEIIEGESEWRPSPRKRFTLGASQSAE